MQPKNSQPQSTQPQDNYPQLPTQQAQGDIETTPDNSPTATTEPSEQTESPQLTAEEIFAQQLQEKYGLTPDQLQQGIQTLSETQVQQQANQLQQSWGVDQTEFTRRLTAIQDQYGAAIEANPELDTVQGLQNLWSLIEAQNLQANGNSSVVTSPSGSDVGYDYTSSQLMQMSQEELTRNWKQITLAYSQNRVLIDG